MSDLIFFPNDNIQYGKIDPYCFQDTSLCWKERGILCFLMTREGESINLEEFSLKDKEKITLIRNAIKRLCELKYLYRARIYVRGMVQKYIYIVFSRPTEKIPEEILSCVQEKYAGKLVVDPFRTLDFYCKKNIAKNIAKNKFKRKSSNQELLNILKELKGEIK